MPSDLVSGLVFTNLALTSLQRRIKELHVEKTDQRELYKQARQKHVQLLQDKAEMEAEIAGNYCIRQQDGSYYQKLLPGSAMNSTGKTRKTLTKAQ